MVADEIDKASYSKKRCSSFGNIPTRYVIGCLGALAILINYWIKICLSVAIVAMVKTHPKNLSTINENTTYIALCPGADKIEDFSENTQNGDFEWNEKMQGVVLSSYYYGYITTQFLGGMLSHKYGGKYVVGTGLLLAGLFCILSPVAATLHEGAFIAARVLQGISSGVIFPGLQTLFANWFVPKERQVMFSIIFSSTSLGSVISMSISGILSSVSWQLAFYVPGAVAFAWFAVWVMLAYSSPVEHPRISAEEKNYILERIGKDMNASGKSIGKTPYIKILTSIPVWTFVSLNISFCYISYTFMTELPTFTYNILHYSIQNSGFLSAVPLLSSWMSSLCSSFISQWIQKHGYLSKMNTYKLFNTFAMLGPVVCLFSITFLGCHKNVIIGLLVLTMVCNGSYYGGSALNHMDLANNYVGFIAGLNLTAGNATAIIAPLIAGALTNENQTLFQWNLVFYIAMVVSGIPYFIFLLFGSVKEQDWNRIPEKRNQEDIKCDDKRQSDEYGNVNLF